MSYENRVVETVERVIDLPNGVKLKRKHVDYDMSAYDAWFIVFPDDTKEIELDISDIHAERFAMWMNGAYAEDLNSLKDFQELIK